MRLVLVLFAIGLPGCGDEAVPGCDPDVPCAAGTGTGTGTPGTMAAEDDGPGASAEASGGSGSSATPSTSASSDDTDPSADATSASAGTGSEDGTTSAESTGPTTGGQGNVVYSAQALVGALDRILVFKEDLDDDRCAWIVLVSPGGASPFAVTTSAGWSVEQIHANDVGAACGSDDPAMSGAEDATSADGTIDLGAPGASGIYPCDVTVDVTAHFMGLIEGVPMVDVFDAVAIPVDGC